MSFALGFAAFTWARRVFHLRIQLDPGAAWLKLTGQQH
jgi:hypothetical protein